MSLSGCWQLGGLTTKQHREVVRGGGSFPANWAASGAARLSGRPYYRLRLLLLGRQTNCSQKIESRLHCPGCWHVRRLQATLHRSTCLYMGAGCLQSDGQTNAKVTAMQLLLKREDRGVLKVEFLCLRANLVLQSMRMDTSYLLQLFGE